MRILILVDKVETAIYRLAGAVKRNNPQHQIQILPVHPKRNDTDTLYQLQNWMQWCDLLDVHYWKSGEIALQSFGKEVAGKPKILFHFNPYDVNNVEVNRKYDMVVVGNQEMQHKLPSAQLIPYGIDLNFFRYQPQYPDSQIVNMVVNRIEGKKGIFEVAQACKELGFELHLYGRVSKPEYAKEVMQLGSVRFTENATEEQLVEGYYQAAIHVCNSVDNFESGTLPILEAMACGTPVLTRNVGHVPDLFDGKNMVVRTGAKEDLEDLKHQIQTLIENKPWRAKLREAAWQTVKNRNDKIMARQVSKLYNKLYLPEKPLVSVIIPTKDNPESFGESLVAALFQNYQKLEIVVADSGQQPIAKIVEAIREKMNIPIKYIYFDSPGYTLAEARNRAVIEAEGEYLVFCDDRLAMKDNAVTELARQTVNRSWTWGTKDGVIKGFVENFSCIRRDDFVYNGMFNERLEWYGGMTQEIRTRYERNGFDFIHIPSAHAKPVRGSKNRRKRQDIINAKLLINKLYA